MRSPARPRVLFLDDDPARAEAFLAAHPGAVWVRSVEGCLARLGESWDEIHLDHDLDGGVFVDHERDDSGMGVVRWLCQRPRRHLAATRFVVHTHNPNAACLMVLHLEAMGYDVRACPFGEAARDPVAHRGRWLSVGRWIRWLPAHGASDGARGLRGLISRSEASSRRRRRIVATGQDLSPRRGALRATPASGTDGGPDSGRDPRWRRRLGQLSEALILAMACFSPWAFGSVDARAEFGLELGAVLVTVLGLVAGRSGQARHLLCLPSLALAGLVVLGAVQATPLPGEVFRRVAPTEAGLRASLIPRAPERVLGDPGLPVALPPRTLSQIPEATLDTAARLAATWLLFQAVLGSGGGSASFRRFGLAIAINAALLALFSLVQALTWNGKIYWIFPMTVAKPGAWSMGGPFVCHSHLAEYLNIGLGFALGLLLPRARGKEAFLGAAYGASILVVGVITSHSRGGFLAMLASASATAVIFWMRPGRHAAGPRAAAASAPRDHPLTVGAGLVAMLTLVALFLWTLGDSSPYRKRLATILDPTDRSLVARMEIWKDSLVAWGDHPTWGTGLGSFAVAAAPYVRHDDGGFWSHAENVYVQMLVEGGTIGLGLALAALVGIARLAWRALGAAPTPRDRGAVLGALFGGLALLLHGLTDFGLYIPGVAVTAAILTAHLCRLGLGADSPAGVEGGRPRRGPSAILAGLAMALLAPGVAARGLDQTRAEALLAGAGILPPGAAMPTPDRGGLPDGPLQRKREALEGALRLRPDWAEGHLRLGITYLDLYQRTAAAWVSESVQDPAQVALLSDPLWLLGVAHSRGADRPASAGELLGHEPIRRYLVPAARCFLEARRCCPVSALAQAELASLDYLLVGGDPAPTYAGRAARLAADEATLIFISRVAVQAGDLDLAARCWRKSLELGGSRWQEVADAAGAALPPERISRQVLPPRGQYVLQFADRLYAGPVDREDRGRFLRTAIACLPDNSDPEPAERLWLEAGVRARLDERARARAQMEAALRAEPLRGDWRAEWVAWLIAWGDPEEAHHQALIGSQLDPSHPGLRRALGAAVETLARRVPGQSPNPDAVQLRKNP